MMLARKVVEDSIIERGFGYLTKEDIDYGIKYYECTHEELIEAYTYFATSADQAEFREKYHMEA